MKILMFIDGIIAGGKERRLTELLKGLREDPNIECELVVMEKDIHYEDIQNLGIKIHYLIRKIKKDPTVVYGLYKICKKFKPDYLHSWGSMAALYAIPVAKILQITSIAAVISDAPEKLPIKNLVRIKLIFPFTDIIISNSFAGLKPYKAPMEKSVCIHNGIDSNRISNIEDAEIVKQRYGITNEKVVGMVAAFSDMKDYETFIKAAIYLLESKEIIKFLLIGDGAGLYKCKAMVPDKLNDKILFLGKQKRVESIVNIFDVGVLATFTEGISNSIMEYMALGKAVVATDGGGTKELVIDNKTGLLVRQKDFYQLADKIKLLLDNPELCRQMGLAGKKRIDKDFNLKKMTDAYVNLYNNLYDSTANKSPKSKVLFKDIS